MPVFERTERMPPDRWELLRYRVVWAGIRGTECVLKLLFDFGIEVNLPLEMSTSLLSRIRLSLLISAERSVRVFISSCLRLRAFSYVRASDASGTPFW